MSIHQQRARVRRGLNRPVKQVNPKVARTANAALLKYAGRQIGTLVEKRQQELDGSPYDNYDQERVDQVRQQLEREGIDTEEALTVAECIATVSSLPESEQRQIAEHALHQAREALPDHARIHDQARTVQNELGARVGVVSHDTRTVLGDMASVPAVQQEIARRAQSGGADGAYTAMRDIAGVDAVADLEDEDEELFDHMVTRPLLAADGLLPREEVDPLEARQIELTEREGKPAPTSLEDASEEDLDRALDDIYGDGE